MMRWPLFVITAALTVALALWATDAARPDALDGVRVGLAVALLGTWLPMVTATFYAFRCHDLERRVKTSSALADRIRRGK